MPSLFKALATADPLDSVALDADQARHAKALRLRPGDVVKIVNGTGSAWSAELLDLGRREAIVRVIGAVECPGVAPVELWAPVGHRERSLWLVEKSVELGVERVCFVEWERSRSVQDGGRSDAFLEKARGRAIGALKQCGGSILPDLAVVSLGEALAAADEQSVGRRRWLAERPGAALADAANRLGGASGLVYAVGPEGGLTDTERELLSAAGFDAVSLGPRTLRFETAAIVGLAAATPILEGAGRTQVQGDPADEAR